MLGVILMNERQAIAYGQIALDSILHSTYKDEISLENLGLEMKQAFKMYPRNISLEIASAKVYAEKKLTASKGRDAIE